jgi:hypothetical protein
LELLCSAHFIFLPSFFLFFNFYNTVTGITKTSNRHQDILDEVGGDYGGRFTLQTSEDRKLESGTKYKYCVFCAPPSGFDDYPGALTSAIGNTWEGPSDGGIFVFTSSGGIYGPGDDPDHMQTVNEDSPLPDPSTNPRSAKLMGAEQTVLAKGGTVLRLAGLYTLDRGAHNYWLRQEEVAGRPDGIINLLHYDDAAGSVVAALSSSSDDVRGKVFLVSDSNPLTRQEICESSKKSAKYSDTTIPRFLGSSETDPKGKIYDGSATNRVLKWSPRYPSFDEFMASQQ